MQGIYGIYNKEEKRWWYVGQSNNMTRRHMQHKKPSYTDYWHTYFREHQDEFEFVELEWVALRQNLLARERHYIEKLNPKYTTVEANKGSHVGPLSEERKDKISETITEKFKDENYRKKVGESKIGKPAWNSDKTGVYSEETLNKMSNSHKGKCTGEDNPMNKNKYVWVCKNNDEKLIIEAELQQNLDNGWERGRLPVNMTEDRKTLYSNAHKDKNKDKIWITNDIDERMVKQEDFNTIYKQKGFRKGRKKRA